MPLYHVYNSHTARGTTLKAKNETSARRRGRKLIGTKKGIVRAYRVKR